jgi:hypothetical protein
VSVSERSTAVAAKTGQWLAAGARGVLLVDGLWRAVELVRPAGRPGGEPTRIGFGPNDRVSVPGVLPGWSMPVHAMFPG